MNNSPYDQRRQNPDGQICWPYTGSFRGHQQAFLLAAHGQKLLAIDRLMWKPHIALHRLARFMDQPVRIRRQVLRLCSRY